MPHQKLLVAACVAAFVACAAALWVSHARTQSWNAGLVLLAATALLAAATLGLRRS
ncbi:MAG TPA: hypothetical protein VF746_03490 [Longimicrobium sp.]|jgi:isoprenylcysteine carboxyl methyltransferase (ICMT) family protein YpbQ